MAVGAEDMCNTVVLHRRSMNRIACADIRCTMIFEEVYGDRHIAGRNRQHGQGRLEYVAAELDAFTAEPPGLWR